MRSRVLWIVGSGLMGVLLLLSLPSAMAQQGQHGQQGAQSGNQTNQTDIGQQGEFEGQHGLQIEGQDFEGAHNDGAFLDGEHNDGAFLDGEHNAEDVDNGNVQQEGEHEQRTSVGSNKEHDLNIEQILDLQEIRAAELAETR